MAGRHWRVTMAAVGLLAALLVTKPASTADSITIGVAGPLTGDFVQFGEQIAAGAQQAVADINRAGGVLDKPLRLIVGDDACEPAEAANVARRLVRRDAALVDGHFCSSASIAAAPIYDRGGTIMISPGSTKSTLTEIGLRNVFRVVSPDEEQARFVARYIGAKRPRSRVAVIGDDSAYGDGIAGTLVQELRKADRPAVLVRSIRQGRQDFTPIAGAVRRAGASIVFYGGFATEAAGLAEALADLPRKPQLIGPDAFASQDFSKLAGNSADGTLVVQPPDATKRPAAQPVVRRLLAAGVDPGEYVLPSYATVQVWAEAVSRARTTQAAKVASALRAGRFDTVLGSLRFTASGDPATPRFTFYRWRDGRLQPRDVP